MCGLTRRWRRINGDIFQQVGCILNTPDGEYLQRDELRHPNISIFSQEVLVHIDKCSDVDLGDM